MKHIYQLVFFILGGTIICNGQSSLDPHNFSHPRGGNTTVFMNDVIVAPNSMKQHGTSITVAFNGWVYVATGLETMDSDSSGGIIRMSRDNGYTWTTFASYLYPNVDYISPEIEVAGTDTNNLFLFIASAWYDTTTGNANVWVDKYNARNGAFIMEVYSEGMQYPVRDVDIVSDYRYPAWLSSPYSVGLLYSHYGSTDSIIFVSSGDGGNSWGNRIGVAGTLAYVDQVSLAFGITANWGNGRYFAAWEERSGFTSTTIGNIKTAHCVSTFSGPWTTPFTLDVLDPSISGVMRRPSIACQYNSMANNDSSGISVSIVFERAYGGDTADCDILGFYSKSQPSTNYWYRFDILNNSTQTLQPDISYDPAYNNFLLTYFNRSSSEMPYLVHDYNMINPSNWVTIVNNYCDQPSMVKNPFPRVTINPALTQAAFSWTQHVTPTREQAMFDAEYMTTSIQAAPVFEENFSLYPNPAQQQTLLTFNLENTEKVRIDIYDLSGHLVMNILDQTVNSGPQQIYIPLTTLSNGTYLVSLASNSIRKTTRLIISD